MPDEVFALSDRRWRQANFAAAPVRFYRLTDVFVAGEGLVFDRTKTLFGETRKAHSDKDIRQALGSIETLVSSPDPNRQYSRAILCKQSGSENYGHWLTEMLPKLFLSKSELGFKHYLYVVPSVCGQMGDVICESAALAGVSKDELLPLDRGAAYFAELIVLEGLTDHSVYMSPLVLSCLDRLSHDIVGTGAPRVYLRRTPANARDFENEAQVADILTSAGFTPVTTSRLSFREQIAVVRDAQVVLGTMGAAMANVAFCRPGSEVCLFGPASAREFFFWFVANLKHLVYYEVRCPEVGVPLGPLPWDHKIALSAQELQDFIGKLWF
ncbi:glycosyltransferase family 61 protein [Acidiphilium sp.]|uniref:glycosyltransferase family 61 protein n=1 Tax=Acidiphilium sp. TaxID=527 RepID=UPI003D06E02A